MTGNIVKAGWRKSRSRTGGVQNLDYGRRRGLHTVDLHTPTTTRRNHEICNPPYPSRRTAPVGSLDGTDPARAHRRGLRQPRAATEVDAGAPLASAHRSAFATEAERYLDLQLDRAEEAGSDAAFRAVSAAEAERYVDLQVARAESVSS